MIFDKRNDERKRMLIEECVGAGDYDDEYNPTYEGWNRRTVTGMDNNPRMKEMFV